MSKFKSDPKDFLIEQIFYSLHEFYYLSNARTTFQKNPRPSSDTFDGSNALLSKWMTHALTTVNTKSECSHMHLSAATCARIGLFTL